MLSDIALESVILLALILAGGALAMSELAVVSSRKIRLRQRAKKGDRGAAAALELAESPETFLSTVQIGITLVGILAGVFGGATVAEQIEGALSSYPQLAPYAEAVGVTVVVVAITYFSLILGELVPKRIALNDPEKAASLLAPTMRRLARLASPAVRFLAFSTSVVLRLLRARPSSRPPVTEEEITGLIEEGTRTGAFDVKEKDMVEHIFRLADRSVASVMTPRSEVAWIDLEASPERALETLRESGRSRLPAARGDLEHVEGVFRVVDWVGSGCDDARAPLASAVRPAIFVPESALALNLLERLQKAREHVAFVVDEHGGFAGVVTLHDLMEAIVGELPHIGEPQEPLVVRREDGSWLVDGSFPMDDFKDLLGAGSLDREEAGFHTVGGLVMSALGRIPQSGDCFEIDGVRIEVVDMDRNRVDKILVTRRTPSGRAERTEA